MNELLKLAGISSDEDKFTFTTKIISPYKRVANSLRSSLNNNNLIKPVGVTKNSKGKLVQVYQSKKGSAKEWDLGWKKGYVKFKTYWNHKQWRFHGQNLPESTKEEVYKILPNIKQRYAFTNNSYIEVVYLKSELDKSIDKILKDSGITITWSEEETLERLIRAVIKKDKNPEGIITLNSLYSTIDYLWEELNWEPFKVALEKVADLVKIVDESTKEDIFSFNLINFYYGLKEECHPIEFGDSKGFISWYNFKKEENLSTEVAKIMEEQLDHLVSFYGNDYCLSPYLGGGSIEYVYFKKDLETLQRAASKCCTNTALKISFSDKCLHILEKETGRLVGIDSLDGCGSQITLRKYVLQNPEATFSTHEPIIINKAKLQANSVMTSSLIKEGTIKVVGYEKWTGKTGWYTKVYQNIKGSLPEVDLSYKKGYSAINDFSYLADTSKFAKELKLGLKCFISNHDIQSIIMESKSGLTEYYKNEDIEPFISNIRKERRTKNSFTKLHLKEDFLECNYFKEPYSALNRIPIGDIVYESNKFVKETGNWKALNFLTKYAQKYNNFCEDTQGSTDSFCYYLYSVILNSNCRGIKINEFLELNESYEGDGFIELEEESSIWSPKLARRASAAIHKNWENKLEECRTQLKKSSTTEQRKCADSSEDLATEEDIMNGSFLHSAIPNYKFNKTSRFTRYNKKVELCKLLGDAAEMPLGVCYYEYLRLVSFSTYEQDKELDGYIKELCEKYKFTYHFNAVNTIESYESGELLGVYIWETIFKDTKVPIEAIVNLVSAVHNYFRYYYMYYDSSEGVWDCEKAFAAASKVTHEYTAKLESKAPLADEANTEVISETNNQELKVIEPTKSTLLEKLKYWFISKFRLTEEVPEDIIDI